MKQAVVFIIFLCATLVSAYLEDIDWTKIKNRDLQVKPKGRPAPGPRVIGGKDAVPHSHPSLAFLTAFTEDGGVYICGGTLITPKYILTAAHCVEDVLYVEIALGAHDLGKPESTRIILTSADIIIHEQWDSDTIINDIALIQLGIPATLTPYIATATLVTGTETYGGVLATVAGWGLMSDNSDDRPDILQEVDVLVMSNSVCRFTFEQVGDSQICTRGDGPKGSCAGDSGGPLLINDTQIGIISYGAEECMSGYPSVFTRLTEYQDWIAKNSDYVY